MLHFPFSLRIFSRGAYYEKELHCDILRKEKVAKYTLFSGVWESSSSVCNFSMIFAHFQTKRDTYWRGGEGQNPLVGGQHRGWGKELWPFQYLC
jgi:hypothetical protein